MAYGVNMLKIKAFIYRLSAVFGRRIYLAEKEEGDYFKNALFANLVLGMIDEKKKEVHRSIIGAYIGMWHAKHGFTTMYTRNMSRFEAIRQTIIHTIKG
jgi:hypothetical protein